jgi:elongation factor Ts
MSTTKTTITTEQIKELREQTGISVMQVRKALEESGGDKEKALILLRKKGSEALGKKADRTFGAGAIAAYVHANGAVASMVELLAETDFVSGNEEFKALARDIAMQVAATNPEFLTKADITAEARAKAMSAFEVEVKGKPENMKEKILEGKANAYFADRILLEQPFIKNPDLTIANLIENAAHKFGEKIAVARFTRFSVLGK